MSTSTSHFADTPEARLTIERQHEITDAACVEWDLDRIETPDDRAPLDFLLARDGYVRAVVEVKARNLTRDEFLGLDNPRSGRHGHSGFMFGAHKLDHGGAVSVALRVPFYLLAGIYPTGDVWVWRLCNGDPGPTGAGWLVPFQTVDRVNTQAHAEGGRKLDRCAFVPVRAGAPLGAVGGPS